MSDRDSLLSALSLQQLNQNRLGRDTLGALCSVHPRESDLKCARHNQGINELYRKQRR